MKNLSTEIYKEALGKLTFPDEEHFSCVNEAYSGLTLKIFDEVNKMAPTKTIKIKNNTNEWFDRQIEEKIDTRDKCFRNFKKLSEVWTTKQEIPYKLQLKTKKENFYKRSYLKIQKNQKNFGKL